MPSVTHAVVDGSSSLLVRRAEGLFSVAKHLKHQKFTDDDFLMRCAMLKLFDSHFECTQLSREPRSRSKCSWKGQRRTSGIWMVPHSFPPRRPWKKLTYVWMRRLNLPLVRAGSTATRHVVRFRTCPVVRAVFIVVGAAVSVFRLLFFF